MSDPAAPPSVAAEADFSVDAFHFGRFTLVQPAVSGHRAGMDAMLLAATVADGATGSVADLGAGAGAAGLAVAARVPGITVTLVERAPVMVDFARRTLARRENALFAGRASVIEADVALTGAARREAGLADDAHEVVIMNPPFNERRDRPTPDALKAEAHAMQADLFDRWIRTAGAILKPGGQLSVIARPQSIAEILLACERRFGGVEITPVRPRCGDDAIRILVTAIKGSRARLALRQDIVIHDGPGHRFAPLMDDLNNGRAGWPRRSPARRPR